MTPDRPDSRRPRTTAQWKALIAALGELRRGNYPGGPLRPGTCICDHPHGECLLCGCVLLAFSLPHVPELFKITCRQCGDHQAVIALNEAATYTLNCTRCTVTEIL